MQAVNACNFCDMIKKNIILPVFLDNAGCVSRCSFCNQQAVESAQTIVSVDKIRFEIERQLRYLPRTGLELAFYGGTFTALPADVQVSLLDLAEEYYVRGIIRAVRISTRPDALNENIVTLLKRYHVTTVEVGAQSLSDKILRVNNRRHSYRAVQLGIDLLKNSGITTGLHLMTGLLGDDETEYLLTVERLINVAPDFIRIHPTLVLSGTYLEELWKKGEYVAQSVQQALTQAAWLKITANSNGVKVLRMGLQPSAELNCANVIAGPFHPAFAEKVDNLINLWMLDWLIVQGCQREIFCNPQDLSKVIGQKRCNVRALLDVKQLPIQVICDSNVPKDSLYCYQNAISISGVKSKIAWHDFNKFWGVDEIARI